jgi:NTP pyrophosphatase (non-canonical NTP hydrolase)
MRNPFAPLVIEPFPHLVDDLQARSLEWLKKTPFKRDLRTRAIRFLEEAVELAQACGLTEDDILKEVDDVMKKEVGILYQEVGGAGITLLSLCAAAGISAGEAINTEIVRANRPEVLDKILKKHR